MNKQNNEKQTKYTLDEALNLVGIIFRNVEGYRLSSSMSNSRGVGGYHYQAIVVKEEENNNEK